MDGAELGVDLFDGGADLGLVADVAGVDEGAAAVGFYALGEGAEDFLAAGDHGHMGAGGCEFQGDGFAEAAAGAGYDYVLAGKITQCTVSFLVLCVHPHLGGGAQG